MVNSHDIQRVRQTITQHEQEFESLQKTIAEQEVALSRLKQEVIERERVLNHMQQALGQQEFLTLDSATESPAEPGDVPSIPSVTSITAWQPESLDKDYKIALALTLANVAYDSLIVVDETYKLIAINDSAEALFNVRRPIGETLEQVTGLPELEMMVADALSNEEEIYEEQITYNRRPYRVRCRVIRRDEHLFIGLALQDVSELVRLNRARRDMVANISHELRTPIANIRLIIDSLFHEQDKPKRKQSASALKAIARETDSLLWLVQELLDLSMIESGQAILRLVETPVRAMVDEAVERMVEQSNNKDQTLLIDIPNGLLALADGDLVRRVLINLIHNAIKWSPPGEKITVRAEPHGTEELIISVLDNGPGVPEEHRERIFERFYQVDSSRSTGEGTGLGLAISKHIVEAHGGRIWVENNDGGKDGRGGYFRFTLPAGETMG